MTPDMPGGPPGPQSLVTLLTGVCLATTLMHWSFASGICEMGVCLAMWSIGGIYSVPWAIPKLGHKFSVEMYDRVATAWPTSHEFWPN
jgi:hypothetical protein